MSLSYIPRPMYTDAHPPHLPHPHPLPHSHPHPESSHLHPPPPYPPSHPPPHSHPHPPPNSVHASPANHLTAAAAPSVSYRQNQQIQNQPQHQQSQHPQQQFYPNAYPHTTPSPSPSPSSSLIQPQGTGPQAHGPNQIQDFGNGRPTSMPPPSNLPDATFVRRANLQPQRAIDRWPSGTNEEQRQMQDQYTQRGPGPTNFYYNQQQHQQHQQQQQQQQHMSTAASSAPVSTFSPHDPSQPPSTPPSSASQPQPMIKSGSSASESSKPSGNSSIPPSLEAQRVTALLEMNSVLLQEVVNLQNAGKTDMSTQSQQPSPPHEQGPGTPVSSQRTQQPSPPEEKGSTTPAPNQRGQPLGKVAAPKDYIEYMRRLQANLAYLASIAEQHSKPQNPIPQFPAIMEAPGATETENGKEWLRDMYVKMRELWPDYRGKT